MSESEPETSGTIKGSVEDFLIIEQDKREEEEREISKVDEKSSGSPSTSTPILPDILASR